MVEKQTVEMHEVDQELGWSWGSHVRAPLVFVTHMYER